MGNTVQSPRSRHYGYSSMRTGPGGDSPLHADASLCGCPRTHALTSDSRYSMMCCQSNGRKMEQFKTRSPSAWSAGNWRLSWQGDLSTRVCCGSLSKITPFVEDATETTESLLQLCGRTAERHARSLHPFRRQSSRDSPHDLGNTGRKDLDAPEGLGDRRESDRDMGEHRKSAQLLRGRTKQRIKRRNFFPRTREGAFGVEVTVRERGSVIDRGGVSRFLM